MTKMVRMYLNYNALFIKTISITEYKKIKL
jgi:hypothetical protein